MENTTPRNVNINVVILGDRGAGKSTLTGNFLVNCQSPAFTPEDVEQAKVAAKKVGATDKSFAFLLDTLQIERDRGLTVNNSSPLLLKSPKFKDRSYSVVDTPGHRRYSKHAVQAASQADVAILVISCATGEFETGMSSREGQTRELALVAYTLGVKEIVVACNKIDSVQFNESRFLEVTDEVARILQHVGFFNDKVRFVPLSGLGGDNLTSASNRMPWYRGPTLLEALDSVSTPRRHIDHPFRLSVRDVHRRTATDKIVTGVVSGGIVRVGDKVTFAPGALSYPVKSIQIHHENVAQGVAGDHIGMLLGNVADGDVCRGFVCGRDNSDEKYPKVAKSIVAHVVIISHPNGISNSFTPTLRCHTAQVPCHIHLVDLLNKRNGSLIEHNPSRAKSGESVSVKLTPTHPLCVETFATFPRLGCFVLCDMNHVVAVGMVKGVEQSESRIGAPQRAKAKKQGTSSAVEIKTIQHAKGEEKATLDATIATMDGTTAHGEGLSHSAKASAQSATRECPPAKESTTTADVKNHDNELEQPNTTSAAVGADPQVITKGVPSKLPAGEVPHRTTDGNTAAASPKDIGGDVKVSSSDGETSSGHGKDKPSGHQQPQESSVASDNGHSNADSKVKAADGKVNAADGKVKAADGKVKVGQTKKNPKDNVEVIAEPEPVNEKATVPTTAAVKAEDAKRHSHHDDTADVKATSESHHDDNHSSNDMHDATLADATGPPPMRCFKASPPLTFKEALAVLFEARPPEGRPDVRRPDEDDAICMINAVEVTLPQILKRDSVRELMTACDLKEDDVRVILAYKMEQPFPMYRWLNALLTSNRRDADAVEKVGPMFTLLYRALEKLPRKKSRASRAIVVRNIPALKAAFDNYTTRFAAGEPLGFWGFSSFSTNDEVINNEFFIGKAHEQAIVCSCGAMIGVDVEAFSPPGMPNEAELLPLAPAMFEVQTATKIGNKVVVSIEQKSHYLFAYLVPKVKD